MNVGVIGKVYPLATYAVGRENIREYALAVGETNPLHLSLETARAAGYADLVAPPMFVAVYTRMAMFQLLLDPEVGIDFTRMVHGAQEFEWHRLVIAGEDVSTTASVTDIAQRGGMQFYTIETVSSAEHGELVCIGTWTNIVRGDRRR